VPPIKHVFVVSLGPNTFDALFGAQSQAPYLARELTAKGTLLSAFAASATSELANGLAAISGQAPNAQTLAGCPTYSAVTPGDIGADGQAHGDGCVYSQQVSTLPDQLTAAGLTWRAYIEDEDAAGPPVESCRRPEIGQLDPWQMPRPGDAYLTSRNPFVYFQAITSKPECAATDVGLGPLVADLAKAETTPTLSWIAPNACHDGRATPCAEGAAAGPPAADAWLRIVVPEILASPAYAEGGVVAIVPDGSGTADARTGALLLSRFVAPGARITARYDHLSLLKSVEDLFSLPHLAGVQPKAVKAFDTSVYARLPHAR